MESSRYLALSIVIPTPGRVESLRAVLAGLAARPTNEIYEVVVVDNASEPPVTEDALRTPGIRSLRLLREPQKGKCFALNRALDEGGLGEIVAVVDDDMSPPEGWIDLVMNATRRLPQYEIFSGKSHVVWPTGVPKPAWAEEPLAQGLLFSVFDTRSDTDVEFGVRCPRFPSGNHFWFRRTLTDAGARFPVVWCTEAYFVVRLGAVGHRGVFVPEVRIGHRIQPELVDARKFLERAHKIGREMAVLDVGLTKHKPASPVARLRGHLRPLRAFLELCGWTGALCLAYLRSARRRLPARAQAIWGIEYCRARLHPSLGGTAG
ncbi:MAG: glycosyltransferase family 2 protein [Planctomycetes bacterium]|nr:glycosyltransferase family 2 protein [Planctomycetota bacterium]